MIPAFHHPVEIAGVGLEHVGANGLRQPGVKCGHRQRFLSPLDGLRGGGAGRRA